VRVVIDVVSVMVA